jgi:acylphosphatase
VEAVFEGPERLVDEMVDWSRRGPDLALVERLEVLAEEPVGDTEFRVTG